MGRYSGKTCRLLSMLGLTASFFLVEIIVGYMTNSIALVADSFHMLSDVVALIVGFASVRISKWRTQKNTFGWARAEVLGALVNSVFLIALCFSILVEALKRIVEVEEIKDPKLLLIVGCAGLAVNIIGLFLFHDQSHGHGHSHGGGSGKEADKKAENVSLVKDSSAVNHTGEMTEKEHRDNVSETETDDNIISIEFDTKRTASSAQLNMRGVFLHVLGDALGSVIVIVSALIIWFVEEKWAFYVDPSMSILLVIIILSTTIPLFKESGLILLQTVPTHIKVEDLKTKVQQVTGVLAVHELHVWQLAGNRIIASAHVQCHNIQDYMNMASNIKALFHNEGIHSSTIQPEFVDLMPEEFTTVHKSCALECGPDKKCYPDTCCAVRSFNQKVPKKESDSDKTGASPV
ncbi:hypothetical protein ACJMK2_019633 [Sinanodonta woodiana]|uniref:Zinc transporter 1 n=1 Tax=Sinanodonta woodiana TaxID=1069815 RepID=A0ABD3TWE6_SINWO